MGDPVLRDYQKRTVRDCLIAWRDGRKNLVVVSPTGSGKTVIADAIAKKALASDVPVTVLAHTKVLVAQLKERLPPECFVTTPQKATRKDGFPKDTSGLLILDECHHYAAAEWGRVKRWEGRILGLTATPERADGAPLGNLFEEMIISTTYGELIERGLLRDLDIWRPDDRQDSGQLAMDPVEAYRKLANGRRAFVFCDTIERCNEYQAKLSSSATVTSEDDTQARDWAMAAFREGLVNVLFNVYTLTEGVDVPEADVCILARNVGHHSLYLQIVGRVLRGNGRALLVDLPGVSHVFGGLSEPRLYSLDKGIELEKLVMAKDCPQCGTTSGVAWRECPQCKWRPDQRAKAVQITNAELRDVYQGEATPEGYKEKELMRLVNMCLKKNQSLYWAANQYKKLFKEWPAIPANEETKLCEMTKLLAQARQRGAKRSWASVRFKQMFGHWPPR